jgi:peptidylprolyl isomerase
MEAVNKILQDDYMSKVTIIRNGDAAKKFDAVKVFHNYFITEAENQKKQAAINAENKRVFNEKYKTVIDAKLKSFAALRAKATKTKSGLEFVITQKSGGKKPKIGTGIFIHYAGYLENGTLFDSSIESACKAFGTFDSNRAAQNGYQPIPFQAGKKHGMIPGFIEGIEQLSYGDKAVLFIPSKLGFAEAGAGEVIPPNANLIFEIELMKPNK